MPGNLPFCFERCERSESMAQQKNGLQNAMRRRIAQAPSMAI
jgi:hypothetical protein